MPIRHLVWLLFGVGCTTLQTHDDYDPSANFGAYHTYVWKNTTPAQNPLVDQRIVTAVDEQLAAKGLRKADSGASDLFVTYHAAVNQRLNVQSFGYGYGAPYGGSWSSTKTVTEIPEGTLIVDLVDIKKNNLVWRGTAQDELRQSDSPEQAQKRVSSAVQTMFAKYPPRGR